MASGKGCLECRDGCREIVEEGVTGLVVPAGEPAPLAAALLRVLDERGLRDALGRAARTASARYDIRECVSKMEALYDEVLAESGR